MHQHQLNSPLALARKKCRGKEKGKEKVGSHFRKMDDGKGDLQHHKSARLFTPKRIPRPTIPSAPLTTILSV